MTADRIITETFTTGQTAGDGKLTLTIKFPLVIAPNGWSGPQDASFSIWRRPTATPPVAWSKIAQLENAGQVVIGTGSGVTGSQLFIRTVIARTDPENVAHYDILISLTDPAGTAVGFVTGSPAGFTPGPSVEQSGSVDVNLIEHDCVVVFP